MVEPLPFVGRKAVLGELGAALDAARAARGGLVMLTGPAGAGKTRVATQACAGADDFRVVWAWCPPGDGAEAFGPWARVLRELIGDVQGGRVAQASPELRAVVAGRVEDHPAGDPEAARLRLTRDVAETLKAASAVTPLLVVLDDVHEADASSLRLLTDLTAIARTSRVLLLATAREGDTAWHGRTTARALLQGRALCLPIGPLDDGDIGALITSATGRPAADDEVRSVVDRTGGEAFFVTELVRHGVRGAVPASVRAAVEARVAALPAGCADTLAAASVLGVRFGLDVLADVVEVALGGVRDLLADAEAAGLLGELEPGSASFRHQLLRDAVYHGIPAGTRAALHVRAAEVLARHAERGRDVGPAQVAGQLLLAGPEHAGAAARFARQAGDRAAELLAYDDAVAWYERCAGAVETDEELAELLVAAGTARLGASDPGGARSDFLQAAKLAAGRADLLARAALGLGSGAVGIEVGLLDREQIDLLELARAALAPGELGLRAAVTARLSVATTMIEPEERRLALAEEALDLARRGDHPAALAQALAALCDARPGPDHCADRLGWASEIVALAHRLREPALELLGRRLRLVALLETGAVAEADAEVIAFDAVAVTLDHPLYGWYVPLWRGMRALLEGRFDDCRANLTRVEQLGEASGSENAAMLAATQRWCLLAETGERDEIAQLIAGAGLEELAAVWAKVTLSLVAAQLGRPDEARDRLSAVAPRLAAAPRDSEWLPMLAQAAETVAAIGSHPVARDIYGWLTPYADCFVVEGIGAALRGPVHRYLALLADALGERDAAVRHRERALAAAQAIGAPRLVADIETGMVLTGDRFQREGELWVLRFAGHEVRLTDGKGLHDLARLLARPGVPVPAVELASAGAPAQADLGELVDATARSAYRKRLQELEAEAEEADAAGDAGRSARVAAERDALVEQLSAAYGLGGRVRRAGSTAERARTAVTARIRATIERVTRAHPELGRHLGVSVRTGTLCVYEPESSHEWTV